MPTEIFGSVEVWNRALWHWMEVIDAGLLLRRNATAFASLFGIGADEVVPGFAPLFAARGLPHDASPAVKRWSSPVRSPGSASGDGYHSHTFVGRDELNAVDWDETAVDPNVYCYGRSELTDEWIKVGSYLPDPPHGRAPGDEWREEGTLCRVRAMTRVQSVGTDFKLVFDLMARLAERYGDEHVRLVVWFQG
jgi:hypothetical protein